jgi:hypothetical protein
MTEMREKHDEPDDPYYAGGEDEDGPTQKTSAEKTQKQKNLPVDESDTGPATAANDTGEG